MRPCHRRRPVGRRHPQGPRSSGRQDETALGPDLVGGDRVDDGVGHWVNAYEVAGRTGPQSGGTDADAIASLRVQGVDLDLFGHLGRRRIDSTYHAGIGLDPDRTKPNGKPVRITGDPGLDRLEGRMRLAGGALGAFDVPVQAATAMPTTMIQVRRQWARMVGTPLGMLSR